MLKSVKSFSYAISLSTITLLGIILASSNVFATGSSDTAVDLNVNTVLNLSAPDTTTLTCDTTNALCTSNVDLNVSTNNRTGYTLQMNTTSGYSNALTNTAFNPHPTISSIDNAYPVSSPSSFPANHWGYTGGTDKSSVTGGYDCTNNGNYCPILAYSSDINSYAPNHVIKETNTPGANTTTLTFAAKTDQVQTAGTYSTSLTFTAIANYIPNTTLTDGMIMQQVDSAICNNTPLYSVSHKIYTLIDARDNTKYTVAKLADGKCWMTQNLELGEYGTPMTLTNQLSNVGPDGYTLNFAFANNSIYKGNSNHYGNYYNFSQATAGSATTSTEGDALYSICPKNWRLPSAGNSDATSSEFYIMLNNYITTGSWIEDIEGHSGHWEGVTISQFTNAPISIVFSGLVNSETVAGQGTVVRLWSSTPQVSTRAAFDLYANAGGGIAVIPKNAYYRTGYLAVRCLVNQ